MGKGTDLHNRLVSSPLSEEEMRARQPQIPELRLRPDMAVVADGRTTAAEVVGRLANDGIRSIYLQVGEGATHGDAVLVPVERYVELVGRSLAASGDVEALPDGKIIPAGLAQADVEQVDPNVPWT